MTTTRLLLALALVATLLAGPVRAADDAPTPNVPDVTLLRDTIRTNKKALVAANLALTPEQATKFWPVYDRYQQDLNTIQDRYLRIIDDYRANFDHLTDEKAMQLIEQYLDVEADRTKLRREYLPRFAEVLPGREVARFYQIENKMEAVIRYDLASTIPVVRQ